MIHPKQVGDLESTQIIAITLHQGMGRYTTRAKGKAGDDYNWNQKIMGKSFADLNGASGNISKCYGEI